jgi:exodeoxyribonuclease VII small subunit
MPKAKESENNFEEHLSELEALVRSLESGQLGLDESLSKFEHGVRLYKECKLKLGEVDKRVKILTDSLKETDLNE